MADKELLSQEEIDALLHGVLNGQVAAGADMPAPGDVTEYDFGRQNTIIRGSMPALEQIYERFAAGLSDSMFELLRRRAEVAAADSQVIDFAEYMNSLYTPTSVHVVKLHPLPGDALVLFDPRLVFMFIDHYFGGRGRLPGKYEAREFGRTGNRMIERLLERVLAELVSAWAPLLAIESEHRRMAADFQYDAVISARQAVIVNSFEVQLDGSSGALHVVLPCSMLEPIRPRLDAGLSGGGMQPGSTWQRALRDELRSAEVEVVCRLATTGLKLADVMALREGDVIPIQSPQKVTLACRDIPVYHGCAGIIGDRRAMRITGAAG
jgi:flagellar motor switch protein FliM